jgi:hypothetical protein
LRESLRAGIAEDGQSVPVALDKRRLIPDEQRPRAWRHRNAPKLNATPIVKRTFAREMKSVELIFINSMNSKASGSVNPAFNSAVLGFPDDT